MNREYPKSTEQVVNHLRQRGYAVRAPMIHYLLRKGIVTAPKSNGRNRQWQRDDIEQLVCHCEREQIFTPERMARYFFNIDQAQDIRAQHEAFCANPDLPPDAGYFVMELRPGARSAGVNGRVKYRRMTPQEDRARKAEIALALVPGKGAEGNANKPRRPD